ncbi:MAG TPA: hypothetical protein VFL42_07075 [Terriglobales bacterium]|nr:hypothetical protein [Terriglobales bacterium]
MRIAKLMLVLLALASLAAATRKRDPLTEAEADQLREVRMEPLKRLHLFIKFSDARLDAIDQLRGDAKQADGRGPKIHDLLEDLSALFDEIIQNLDTYEGEQMDKDQKKQYRKGVKDVVAASARWDTRLKGLRNAIQMDVATKNESRNWVFALQDAQEALKSCADIAREYAEEKDADKPENKKK